MLSYLATLLVLLLTLFIRRRWRFRLLPSPGVCLPLIGHVYKFDSDAGTDQVGAMWRLYRQHQRDGLMHMNVFGLNTVLIGDFDTLKQVFSLSETTNRLTGTGMEALGREDRRIKGKHHPGLVVSEGRTWTEQRRFTLRTLRDFGFGKQGMEDVILEEVELFKGLIDKHNGEPFDFKNQFNLPILNALWRVTSGERFEYDNQKFKSIVDRLTEMLQRIGNPSNIVIMLYPWITKIYPKFMDRDKTLRIQHEIMDFIEDSVRTHQENLDPAAPNDYTDTVLIEMERTRDPASSFYGEAGMENLTNSLMDLFLAGSETTSTTLTWAMLYMIRYPEIQAKVQAELDTVVGQNKAPTLQDRSSLPYTEAVMMEVQRHANILPAGVHHVASIDLQVRGHTIPANTLIQPLMTEILKGEHWGDGTVFRPERFIDEEGNLRRDEHLIPFSIGKRVCLGETLAKAELFLFFSHLVHSYRLLPELEGELPTEDYCPGFTILPKPYKARLVHRF